MEQKQSEANLPPIGAAADPALIPGLTVPSPRTGTAAAGTEPDAAGTEEAAAPGAHPGPDAAAPAPEPEAEQADAAPPSAAEPDAAAAEGDTSADAGPGADSEPGEAAAAAAPHPDPTAEEAEEPGKPEESEDFRAEAAFTAADRRGSVTLDRDGVRYALDDQACEWTWSEVAAVEYGTSRLGRRLTVTVHTPDERWYPHDIQAPDKATLTRWTEELDTALDAHFEE
ncbi:hypothetical protein [Streptomyces sp. CA-253872]|uniref:hypothetical protein n=1 Tax=Streptomyces sp. CA-253872 TaxID=3240067 RepID=UPI003D94AEE0